MKTLEIDWLGGCPNCSNELQLVESCEGNSELLYDDDVVTCNQCGLEGHIECYDEVAECIWNSFSYTEQTYSEYNCSWYLEISMKGESVCIINSTKFTPREIRKQVKKLKEVVESDYEDIVLLEGFGL